MPRFHLGTGLTRTIVTPNESLVVFGHGNTIWSAQINLFLQRFVFALDLHFSLKVFFCFLLCSLNQQSFLTNQLTKHSSRQSGDYLSGLILVVNILLWSNTVFIITRHGLHGKPALYIYRSCYLLQQCGFMKPPLQDWLSQLHAQRWQVLCISKIWSYA